MKRSILCLGLLILMGLGAFAAKVDTVQVRSASMAKDIKVVVIVPDGSNEQDSLPVLYLLHGYGGNYANWINRAPELADLVDLYRFMVICPDGGRNSWYWDSPENPDYRYEQFVAHELTAWLDAHYPTLAKREGRAISGLSMGGHGALYLAFRHQSIFSAAGSTAGGVDIRPFPLNWGMAEHLGSYAAHPDRWNQYTVTNMLHLLTPGSLSLIIDCGVDDFFYGVNEAFHQKLIDSNIPHTYITGPGKHDWDYWARSIRWQMQFFHYHFLK